MTDDDGAPGSVASGGEPGSAGAADSPDSSRTPEPSGSGGARTVDGVLDDLGDDAGVEGYSYAYLDEHTKREVRRAVLKAVAIPGHQVPYASRPMPLARGWGTGGIQTSLSFLGPDDVFKVIDQGSDESVNAANIRRLAADTADVETTTDTVAADVIQTRHRIPEEVMTDGQVLVLQVPITDPLRTVDPSDAANRRRHAHANYGRMWVHLYESVVEWGEIDISARYPVMVADRYLMDPSPIPRWDVPKLDRAETLFVFAAGREARIYAVPPHTEVEPLAFEDRAFRVERFPGAACRACGSTDTYLTEVETDDGDRLFVCNDESFCAKRRDDPGLATDHHLDREVEWGPGEGGGDSGARGPGDRAARGASEASASKREQGGRGTSEASASEPGAATSGAPEARPASGDGGAGGAEGRDDGTAEPDGNARTRGHVPDAGAGESGGDGA